MPFFSIIIPTFNSEKVISKALSSLIKQTFNDFEILIIDGASTDDTIKIAFNFNDSRIKIRVENDKGVYDAMNKGIKLSTGKWLYFLGSDDELAGRQVLEKVYAKIIKSKEKVVYGNALIHGDTGWAKDGEIYDGEFTVNKLLRKNIAHQAIFYNKVVFLKCGFYNINYKVCADHDFNLKVASKYKLQYVDLVVSNFFSGGLSTNSCDVNLEKDYQKNIVEYFSRAMYKKEFRSFKPYLIPKAKELINQLKLTKAFQLIMIRLFLKLSNH